MVIGQARHKCKKRYLLKIYVGKAPFSDLNPSTWLTGNIQIAGHNQSPVGFLARTCINQDKNFQEINLM